MRLVFIAALMILPQVGLASMFESGKHCVAYKVKKKALSLFSSTVVGRNCDISVQLLPVVGGGYQIEVSVPISSFDSGDKDRDQDVKTILKESEQPDILFRSKVMTEKEWKQVTQKLSINLEGELIIANKSYPISAPSEVTKVAGGIEIDGIAIVPFSKFELKPPKVAGGLIAKADSDLELHFHLSSEKILGADKILSPPEKDKDIIRDARKGLDDDDEDDKGDEGVEVKPKRESKDKKTQKESL